MPIPRSSPPRNARSKFAPVATTRCASFSTARRFFSGRNTTTAIAWTSILPRAYSRRAKTRFWSRSSRMSKRKPGPSNGPYNLGYAMPWAAACRLRCWKRSRGFIMHRSVFALTIMVCGFSLRAEDSPQFRGKGGLGISEKPLPVHWDATENIRWKAALPGRGLSCPVIANGRVFVTACTGANQDRLHVLCFDTKTGKELWHRQLWATGNTLCHEKTCMAAPTPVTDGKRIIALFATADLVCYDIDGNLLWYRSLTGDYPTIGNNVGMAASPILHGDLLLLCLENAGASFAAGIDKHTGKNRWKIDRPRGINWVTPLLIQNAGKDAVLFQGPGELSAH